MINKFSLRNLCALCASAVKAFVYRRDAEGAEVAQRRMLVCAIALLIFAVPAFGQTAAIQPCTPTTSPPRARLLTVDESIPADPDVEKIIAPYSEKVRELSKVIGRLEG